MNRIFDEYVKKNDGSNYLSSKRDGIIAWMEYVVKEYNAINIINDAGGWSFFGPQYSRHILRMIVTRIDNQITPYSTVDRIIKRCGTEHSTENDLGLVCPCSRSVKTLYEVKSPGRERTFYIGSACFNRETQVFDKASPIFKSMKNAKCIKLSPSETYCENSIVSGEVSESEMIYPTTVCKYCKKTVKSRCYLSTFKRKYYCPVRKCKLETYNYVPDNCSRCYAEKKNSNIFGGQCLV